MRVRVDKAVKQRDGLVVGDRCVWAVFQEQCHLAARLPLCLQMMGEGELFVRGVCFACECEDRLVCGVCWTEPDALDCGDDIGEIIADGE